MNQNEANEERDGKGTGRLRERLVIQSRSNEKRACRDIVAKNERTREETNLEEGGGKWRWKGE